MTFNSFKAGAQDLEDSVLNIPLIGIQYSFDIPAADLAKSFGINHTIGASYWHKTTKNWLWGLEYNYVFGNSVKINPLDSVENSDGYLINNSGQYQDLFIYERGHFAMLKVGKIFTHLGANVNSGLFVKAGAGFWLHQVFYYYVGTPPPQLNGDYKKGYDRMTYGPALSQSIGYLNLSTNHMLNFSAEFEIAEGFTKNQRAFNYDSRQKDNSNYLDMTFGIKIGWFFPLYNKVKDKYFH